MLLDTLHLETYHFSELEKLLGMGACPAVERARRGEEKRSMSCNWMSSARK